MHISCVCKCVRHVITCFCYRVIYEKHVRGSDDKSLT